MSNDPMKEIIGFYAEYVRRAHQDLMQVWPILSGADAKIGGYKGWTIWHLVHTGNTVVTNTYGHGELPPQAVRFDEITDENRTAAKINIEKHFRIKKEDLLVLVSPNGQILNSDFEAALRRHEESMGLAKNKIFLSHKGADKPMVRDYDKTLRTLGFDTWLDEDAMLAGTDLERGLSSGFGDSCAAVFFVTKNYKDDGYLATEVTYAMRERREKGLKFQIIVIAFDGVTKQDIPELLRSFVWKTPVSQLDALREIVRALPIKLGDVYMP